MFWSRKPKLHPHLRKPFVAEFTEGQWQVWIPPRGAKDYEGHDMEEGAILAPYGDTYWGSEEEARAFLKEVCG